MALPVPIHPTDPAACSHVRLFTDSARAGLRLLLEARWAPGRGRILLPAYIGLSPIEGSGVFDPIAVAGLPFAFYGLMPDLTVDLASLEALLAEGEAFAVLLIHYFGFPQPALARIAARCRERGALLIEDCAHCTSSVPGGLGTTGDFALFSLHKVFSCPDGGFLQINRPAHTEGLRGREVAAPITPSSLALFTNTDVPAVNARRIANYRALSRWVRAVPGVHLLHPALPEGAVPLSLPVLLESADRFEVYERMRAEDVGVIACYHTLIPQIEPGRFPVTAAISRTILNLPTHQDLDDAQLMATAASLRAALR